MSISPQLTFFYERKRLQATDPQTELEQSDRNIYLWRGAKAHKLQLREAEDAAESVGPGAEDGVQMSDAQLRPQATSPSKRLLDNQSLNRLKERMGIGKRREYMSKAAVPMIQRESARLWVFVAANVLSGFLSMYVDIRACVLGLVTTVVVFVAAIIFQLCFPRVVDKYYGYTFNAVLGIRCSSGPSTFCRIIPSLICLTFAMQNIAVAVYGFDNWDLTNGVRSCMEGGYSNVDNWCTNYYLAIWVVSSVPSITALSAVLLLGLRQNLAPDIEQALVVRAASLEQQNPHIEPILLRGELYAAEVLDPRVLKPLTYQGGLWITAGVSLFIWVRIYTQDVPDAHYDFNFAVTVVLLGLCTWLVLFALFYGALGLWALFEGCFRRLVVLSEYLVLDQDISVEQLDAWWRVRCFYLQTLLPIAYQLCSQLGIASLLMGIVFGLLWTSHLISFISANEDSGSREEVLAEAIKATWFDLAVMLDCFAGALTGINKACLCATEQDRHQLLIQKCRMHLKLMKFSKQLNQPMSDLGSKQQTGVHALYFSSLPDSPRHTGRMAQPASVNVDNAEEVAELLDHFESYLKSSDQPPTIMGLSISPQVVRSVLMSAISAVGVVLLASFQSLSPA